LPDEEFRIHPAWRAWGGPAFMGALAICSIGLGLLMLRNDMKFVVLPVALGVRFVPIVRRIVLPLEVKAIRLTQTAIIATTLTGKVIELPYAEVSRLTVHDLGLLPVTRAVQVYGARGQKVFSLRRSFERFRELPPILEARIRSSSGHHIECEVEPERWGSLFKQRQD
jgi:hypothetical protein